ncbi:hypothetical protein [Trichocoleus sp. FACHB-262]|nr:hypothetical protein [Trichocoleus sp. FACHB-262]
MAENGIGRQENQLFSPSDSFWAKGKAGAIAAKLTAFFEFEC